MSNTPHTLAEEFPGQMDRLRQLKASDADFARLLEDYDAVNDAVHRAETRIDALDEAAEAELRRRRLAIKDRIAQALSAA